MGGVSEQQPGAPGTPGRAARRAARAPRGPAGRRGHQRAGRRPGRHAARDRGVRGAARAQPRPTWRSSRRPSTTAARPRRRTAEPGVKVVYPRALPRGLDRHQRRLRRRETARRGGSGCSPTAGDFVGVRQEDAPARRPAETYVDEKAQRGRPTGRRSRLGGAALAGVRRPRRRPRLRRRGSASDEVLVYGSARDRGPAPRRSSCSPTAAAPLRPVVPGYSSSDSRSRRRAACGRRRASCWQIVGELLAALPEGQRLLEGGAARPRAGGPRRSAPRGRPRRRAARQLMRAPRWSSMVLAGSGSRLDAGRWWRGCGRRRPGR